MMIALFASMVTVWAQEKSENKAGFSDMTVEQVQVAIKDGDVTVIDANGKKSYKAGHLPGALHYASLKKKKLQKALPKDKSALIIAYCGGPQ